MLAWQRRQMIQGKLQNRRQHILEMLVELPGPQILHRRRRQKIFKELRQKIGGILALWSENMTNKVNYDSFCEKLKIFIMNEFKGGENVVEVIQNPSIDVISFFENDNKPEELTEEKKNLPSTER